MDSQYVYELGIGLWKGQILLVESSLFLMKYVHTKSAFLTPYTHIGYCCCETLGLGEFDYSNCPDSLPCLTPYTKVIIYCVDYAETITSGDQ